MMPLSGAVKKAPPNIPGFDWSGPALSLQDAESYYAKGYRFRIRYGGRAVSRNNKTPRKGYPTAIRGAEQFWMSGFALMVVQHASTQ
jgi:hypothetical protein